MKRRFQFQLPVFFGAEALPLVFEDKITCPMFFDLAGLLVFDGNNLPLALKVRVHAPVINPVGSLLCQNFTSHNTLFILAHLNNLPLLDQNLILTIF